MKSKIILFFSALSLIISTLPTPIYAETTPPEVHSAAAILMDAETKTVLYEKNSQEIHFPASITKLMTALLVIEHLSPEQKITFSKDAVYSIEPGSSHIGIKPGEILTVDQALHGLLLMSANEVANGLAEAVSGSLDAFASLMTDRAKELGALTTHFVNAHGLHNSEHYTTAYDMALIGSYLAQNETFLKIMQDTTYEIPPTNITDETRYLYQQHYMVNPSRNSKYYYENAIGGKTGFTDQARHTLVTMAKKDDTTLVAVILQADQKTDMYTDTAALFDYGFEAYKPITLHTTDEILKTLPAYNVKSGKSYQSASYGIGVEENAVSTVLNTTNLTDIVPNYDLPEYLEASYKEGDVVGTVSFTLNGQTIARSNLVVKQITELPPPTLVIPSVSDINPALLIVIGGVGLLTISILGFLFFRRRRYLKRLKRNKKKQVPLSVPAQNARKQSKSRAARTRR